MSDIKSDVYVFWRHKLRGDEVPAGSQLPTIYPPPSMDNPQPGLWRTRVERGGAFVPVRISLADVDDATLKPVHHWREGLRLVATIDGQPVSLDTLERKWHFLQPVSQADIKHYDAHRMWPGDAPTIGHNSKAYGEDFDGIKQEFEDYARLCSEFLSKVTMAGGVKEKAQADQLNNMADAIGNVKGGIGRKADELRANLVAPHLAAQKAVNLQFKPLIEEADKYAALLRSTAAVWTKAEQQKLQAEANERARLAQQEANVEAAKKRAEWEKQQAVARRNGADAAPPEPPPSAPVITAEQVKLQVGGQRGAKRSLRTVYVALVDDHAAALAYFANAPEVVELVKKLAQRVVDAKLPTPPGVRVIEEQRL